MGKRVRYGIAGFGRFAERAIAPAIRESDNSDLVAIQKRSLAEAKAKASEHMIPHAFDSVEDLVRHPEVDAIFIVSVNAAHCPDTVAAAKAEKHVLVEKPMAMNCREAELMISTCRKKGVKLMVGHMLRFSPLLARIKELIQNGTMGAIKLIKSEFIYDGRLSERSWLTDPKLAGGGPIFDVGVHCLDSMRFVLDDEVVSTRSQIQPMPGLKNTESTASLSLKFSRGVLGTITCSYEAPLRRSVLEIIGTEGTLLCEDFTLGSKTMVLRRVQRSGDQVVENIEVPNLYVKEIGHFSNAILRGEEPDVPGEVGLANQRVLDEAIRGTRDSRQRIHSDPPKRQG